MTWSVVVKSKREQQLMQALLQEKQRNNSPTSSSAEKERAPEWTCKCGTPNWLTRGSCRRCGDDRPKGKGKGKGKSKGQARAKSAGRGKGPGTAPTVASEGAKNRLRQEMDMKAVLLRHGTEASEEQEGDVEMEEAKWEENPYEEEEEEEDEDECLLKEWATWDMDKLRKETNELENVLIHSKRVSLTSVTPHLEHRLALLRSEMKSRGTPGFQLDRASKLLDRAKAQREKTEKMVTALEDKLKAAKTKLKDDQAKEAAALTAQQQVQEKIAKEMSKANEVSAEPTAEQQLLKTMAQGITAKLPHFQGMMNYNDVQLTIQKIVAETAQEMQVKTPPTPASQTAPETEVQAPAQQQAAGAALLPAAGGREVQHANPLPPVLPQQQAPPTPPARVPTTGPVHPVMMACGSRANRNPVETTRGRSRSLAGHGGHRAARAVSMTAEMVQEWT